MNFWTVILMAPWLLTASIRPLRKEKTEIETEQRRDIKDTMIEQSAAQTCAPTRPADYCSFFETKAKKKETHIVVAKEQTDA